MSRCFDNLETIITEIQVIPLPQNVVVLLFFTAVELSGMRSHELIKLIFRESILLVELAKSLKRFLFIGSYYSEQNRD